MQNWRILHHEHISVRYNHRQEALPASLPYGAGARFLPPGENTARAAQADPIIKYRRFSITRNGLETLLLKGLAFIRSHRGGVLTAPDLVALYHHKINILFTNHINM